MGLPSGSFTSTYSGRLQVSFRGQYVTNTGSDFGSGANNARFRGYVGTGSTRQTTIIDINNQSGMIEQDYVGGSGPVSVGMEAIDYSLSGPSSIKAAPLVITCVLIKR